MLRANFFAGDFGGADVHARLLCRAQGRMQAAFNAITGEAAS
jgi:hypothetical protein